MKTFLWIAIFSTITMFYYGTLVLLTNDFLSVVALGLFLWRLHSIGLAIFPNQQEMWRKKSVESNKKKLKVEFEV